MKKAIIFGVTGQDGSYLAEFLLKKNYIVHGVKRKSSSLNTDRVDHIYESNNKRFFLHYGDLTDAISVNKLLSSIKPDEIYNLAAQSHVAVSFSIPNYTANVDAIGCLNILEAIKTSGLEKKISFISSWNFRKCMGKFKKCLKMKKLHFILEVHMVFQRYFLTG